MRGGIGSRDSRGGLGASDGLDGLPTLVTAATKGGNGKYLKTAAYDEQGRLVSPIVEGTIGGTTPSPLGTAAAGSSEAVAPVDHVHAMIGSITDTWKVEAATDLGLTPAELICMVFNEPLGSSLTWTGSIASGGSRVFTPDVQGQRVSTGGGAGGAVVLSSGLSTGGTIPMCFLAGAAAKWWVKARMRVNPAGAGAGPVGAGTLLGVSSRSTTANVDASKELFMGVDGAVSTTNFVVTADTGATIDSGVAIDSNVRDHKVWRDGVSTYYSINGAAAVSGTARPGTSGRPTIHVFESAAVLQMVDVYALVFAFPVRALGA